MILDDLLSIEMMHSKEAKAKAIDNAIINGGDIIIKYIFDDMIKFSIPVVRLKELRFEGIEPIAPAPTNAQLEQLLTKIINRELTGNVAVTACANFGNRLTDEQFYMFCDILQSNPRLGINTTDLNKRCKNFKVDQFKVHLCKSHKDVAGKIDLSDQWVVQPKIDGNRIIGIKEYGTVKLLSRKGHVRESLNHIVNILSNMEGDCVFDGEVEYKDSLESTGAIRRKTKQAKDAIYTLFGLYSIKEWKDEKHITKYVDCYNAAKHFVDSLSSEDGKFIKIIESINLGKFESEESLMNEVSKYYEDYLIKGYEGAVIKTHSHVYLPSAGSKRSQYTIKIKPWVTMEAVVFEIKESETNPDSFGAFSVIDAENREFDVAPGHFTKDELDHIWNKQHLYIDKKLEYKCQGRTIYGQPRHPIAIKFRDDV